MTQFYHKTQNPIFIDAAIEKLTNNDANHVFLHISEKSPTPTHEQHVHHFYKFKYSNILYISCLLSGLDCVIVALDLAISSLLTIRYV